MSTTASFSAYFNIINGPLLVEIVGVCEWWRRWWGQEVTISRHFPHYIIPDVLLKKIWEDTHTHNNRGFNLIQGRD